VIELRWLLSVEGAWKLGHSRLVASEGGSGKLHRNISKQSRWRRVSANYLTCIYQELVFLTLAYLRDQHGRTTLSSFAVHTEGVNSPQGYVCGTMQRRLAGQISSSQHSIEDHVAVTSAHALSNAGTVSPLASRAVMMVLMQGKFKRQSPTSRRLRRYSPRDQSTRLPSQVCHACSMHIFARSNSFPADMDLGPKKDYFGD
jgi:hypothetical protein